MPERASRTRIHSGAGAPGWKSRTSRSTNRSHADGSAMLAGRMSPDTQPRSAPSPACAGSPASAGSVNGTPNAIASSRATPRTDTQSPRSGVTAMSSTSSRRPA